MKNAKRTMPDTFFELANQFPPHVRNEEELDAAQEMIDKLLAQDLDEGAQAYLETLTDLVEAYENEHYQLPDASEADVLRELMRSNGLSQPKLAKASGISQSTISDVLNGTRSLTRDQIVMLADLFGVSPVAFLREKPHRRQDVL